ncbi:MAG: hypothetical protein AAGI22_25985 [Planctomycetota bacterium]
MSSSREGRSPRDGGRSPARAIGSLTRFVAARARQAHMARALCGGLASAVLVLTCAVRSGSSIGDPDALLLAVVVGSMAYFGWRLSRSVATATIARRIDRELRLGGAYVAAYETERDRPDSRVGQLGAARLAERIRRRDALEAATPHALGFVVLPMLALAALVAAVHAREAADRLASSGAARSIGLASALERIARDEASAMSEPGRGDIQQVAAQAASAAASSSQDEHRREMADIAEELDRLAREAPPGSDLAEELARAAALAEAASIDIDGEPEGDPAAAESGASEADAADDAPSGDEDGASTASGETPPGEFQSAGEGVARAEDRGTEDRGHGATGTEADPAATGDGAGRADGGTEAPPGQAGGAADEPASVGPDDREADASAGAAAGVRSDGPADGPAETRTVGEVRWWAPHDDGLVRRWAERRGTVPQASKSRK